MHFSQRNTIFLNTKMTKIHIKSKKIKAIYQVCLYLFKYNKETSLPLESRKNKACMHENFYHFTWFFFCYFHICEGFSSPFTLNN